MSKLSRTLAEQIADLDDPTPRDIDPESFGGAFEFPENDGSVGSSSAEEDAGRTHYEPVSKSKLRKPEELNLGKEYAGATVSRRQLESGAGKESDSDDDPFANASGGQSGSSDDSVNESDEEYDDPDVVDLDAQASEDEEIDSDDAFADGDEKTFQSFKFRASHGKFGSASEDKNFEYSSSDEDEGVSNGVAKIGLNGSAGQTEPGLTDDSERSDANEDEDSESMDHDDSDEEMEDHSTGHKETEIDRSAVKSMVAGDQKLLVTTVSEALKEDVSKGIAVKRQRATFQSLVNTRRGLQNSLESINSLVHKEVPQPSMPSDQAVIEAAEAAALKLFNSITALRSSLPSNTSAEKRPYSATLASPTSGICDCLKALDKDSSSHARPVLTKWAKKIREGSTIATQSKFAASTVQPLASVLDAQLSGPNIDRLVSRTRKPRKCAPLQANAGVEEDPNIYDDTDWYMLLYEGLIDSKRDLMAQNAVKATSSIVNGISAQSILDFKREHKQHRAGVDVKASKGRKMRYTVHEKLQNFMAPVDRGTWEKRQADELFAGLLGRKVRGGLREDVVNESDSDAAEAEGLRLFGGS